MRIKRFIASDMRTALRMVRDEQGPDAVILSNRPCEEGVEVVSATDYDEALVHQALRAAAPGIASAPQAEASVPQAAVQPAPAPAAVAAVAPPPVRETLASRARAVFKLGDSSPVAEAAGEPTLAELMTHAAPAAVPAAPAAAAASPAPVATRFEEMMNALGGNPPVAGNTPEPAPAPAPVAEVAMEAVATAATDTIGDGAFEEPAPATSVPQLQVVPRWDSDPAVAAMREELASMRHIIEREMGQFAVERMRGSPARAAAHDTLLGYGCDEALAQSIASKIDPALDPAKVHAPMLAVLAQMISINRHEPIEDGGIIALVGPTGAGKTTTAAKLAARFAARHRARDVALVTTDAERVGACEQLHAHGRKLGVTVCEAHGPEALARTLAQLVDYPLVLVDTAGFGARDRALLGQLTWLRATRNVRSLLVLPANAHPHDMNEVVRRYRMATPEGVVLTKLDETGRLGASLSVVIRNGLSLAYTAEGQQVATDLTRADPSHLVLLLEKLRRAADNPLATEDRHAVVC